MAKPKLAPVPTPAPAAAAAPPAKKKSKLLLIIVAAVVIIGGAGAGGWFYFGRGAPQEGGKHEEKVVKKGPPTFVTLEPFTVNLAEENGDHYLQLGVVYQVSDGKTADVFKAYMPVLRNKILLNLSSKRPSDLASVDGKEKLVTELVQAARQSLPGDSPDRGVDGALLSGFVIQ